MWETYFDELGVNIKSRKGRGKELSIMSMPSLDNDIWGIQKKKLTVIGARPSQGKSALLRAITLDLIIQRKNTMVFSWEETKEGFVENLLSLYGLVNNFDIVTGDFGTEKHTNAINGLKNILMKNNLHIIESRGRTVGDFERLVRQAKNLDCVMVDYLQLIDTSQFNSEKQAYDEFLKTARKLSQELGFAIIVASQINRSTIQNKQVSPPMMNELKGCIHGDSLVGGKRIEDIVKSGDRTSIPTIGGNISPSRLIDVGAKKCYKVTTKSGKQIILSTDTKVLNEWNTWQKSRTLSVGDKIYVKK